MASGRHNDTPSNSEAISQELRRGEELLLAADYVGAQQALDTVLALAVAEQDTASELAALRALLKCTFYRRDLYGALALGHRAAERAREAGLRRQEGLVHNDLGILYGDLELYAEAVRHLYESARLLRKLGDGDLSRPLTNLGNIYYAMGEFAIAFEIYQEAYRWLAPGPTLTQGIVLGNIGRTLTALGRYAEANSKLQESLSLFETLGDAPYRAAAQLKLGQLYSTTGDLGQARYYLEASLKPMPSGELVPWRDEALLALGQLQLRLGQLGEAIDSLTQALAIAEQHQVMSILVEAHRALTEIYERSGKLTAALTHLKAYARYQERLLEEKANRVLRAALVTFEVDRVKQEQAVYQRKNTELLALRRQLEEQNTRLKELALSDPLTGLRNRRYLEDYLDEVLAATERYGRELSVVLIDIDNFKLINDNHSHTLGDAVLIAMARLLAGQLRQADVVVRYGGEEFVIVLPETPLTQALIAAEKLRQAIEGYPWHTLAADLTVTISCGLAVYQPGLTRNELLRLADQELYRAKRSGRNRVCAAVP
jgi:diguanylate cyclase (GGDEF)-like protein